MNGIIKLTTDNKVEVIDMESGNVEASYLQELIGDYPEMVRPRGLYLGALGTEYDATLGDRIVIAVDENGLLKEEHKTNVIPTALYNWGIGFQSPIVGTVIFLKDVNGYFHTIDNEELEQLYEELKDMASRIKF